MLYTMFRLTDSGRIEYFKCTPEKKRQITSLEKDKSSRFSWIINREPEDNQESDHD